VIFGHLISEFLQLSRTGLWICIDLMQIWIWIQFRIQGYDDQKLKKIYSCKTFYIFLIEIAIYLSLGLHKGCTIGYNDFNNLVMQILLWLPN